MRNLEVLNIIQQAVEEHLALEIEYVKYSGESSRRQLSDVHYSEEYGTDYIEALCHSRNEYRTFKIERIRNARLIFEDDITSSPVHSQSISPDYQFNPRKRIFKLYGKDYNL